jgi:hypothetical protein
MKLINFIFLGLMITPILMIQSCKSKHRESLNLGAVSGSRQTTLKFDLIGKSYEYYGSNGWVFSFSADNDDDFKKLKSVSMELYNDGILSYQIKTNGQDLVGSNWMKNKQCYLLRVPGDFYSENYKNEKFKLKVRLKYNGDAQPKFEMMAHRLVK